LMFD